MLKMLDPYIQHIQSTNNQSLLARIYGIFKIETNYFAPVHIMIMQNTCFEVKRRTQCKLTFDIKGSTVDRNVKCLYRTSKHRQLTCYQKCRVQRVLKDINYCELNKESKRNIIRLSSKNIKFLNDILRADSKFLQSQGIMDYSLLLVTEKLPVSHSASSGLNSPKFGRNSYLSNDKKEAYHFGIIDYLQDWNINKKVEAWYKHHLKGKNKAKISAVPPEPY